MPVRICAVSQLPPGFDSLLAGSQREGFRFLARLKSEADLPVPPFLAPDAILLAAWYDDRLAGICGLYRDHFLGDPDVGRLRHLYVARGARRHGVGRSLVDAAVAHASRHFRRLRLRTDTADAARFYVALGFTPTPEDESATHECSLVSR